jgi:hypothetical protein
MSKFCVDCKHCRYNNAENMHECTRDVGTKQNLVTGLVEPSGHIYWCATERNPAAFVDKCCDTIGRYYEAKENPR